MRKRILSLLICLVMIVSMLPVSAHAETGNWELKVIPDKTTAAPGDIVNYTVYVGPVENMFCGQFDLVVPEGLTYVANSGKTVEGLAALLGAASADWTEMTRRFTFYGYGDYTSTKDTALVTFQCKVNDDATDGTYKVNLTKTYFSNDKVSYTEVVLPVNATELTVSTKQETSVDIKVTPDKTDVKVGDVVTYTVSLGKVEHLRSGQFDVVIPEGMEYVAESGKLADGLISKLGAADGSWVDAHKRFLFYGAGDYSSEADTVLATFQCEVTAAGTYKIGLTEIEFADTGFKPYDKQNVVVTELTATVCSHAWTVKKEDTAHYVAGTGLDCQHAKEYYYECSECHVISTTEKFTSTTKGDHVMDTAWTTEGGYHFHKCTVAGCTHVEDKAACSGGTATCTSKAVCTTCRKEYGSTLKHAYDTEHYQFDTTGHWHKCADCPAATNVEPHRPGAAATEETAQTCLDCGYVIAPALGHVHSLHLTHYDANPADCLNDGNKEYYKCDCNKLFLDAAALKETTLEMVTIKAPGHHDWSKKVEDADHYVAGTGLDCQHAKEYYYECSKCHAISTTEKFTSKTKGDHAVNTAWTTEGGYHFHKCTVTGCTYVEDKAACNGGTATCQKKAVCKDCGKEYGALAPHNWTKKVEDAAHQKDAGNCQTNKTYYYGCATEGCNAISTSLYFTSTTKGDHVMDTAWTTEGGYHFHKCTVAGCTHVEDKAACNGGTATCTSKAVCTTCRKEYGSTLKHAYDTEHYQFDETGHWHKCANCSATTNVEPHVPGPAATETAPQTCTECGCELAPMLVKTSVDIKVTPDKTAVKVGDVVTYTVSLGKVEHLRSGQFDVVVPEGMEYVAESGKLADGLISKLGAADGSWVDTHKRFLFYGAGDYSSEADTVLATFQCKVTAAGTYKIGLTEIEFADTGFKPYDKQNVVATKLTATQNAETGVTVSGTATSFNSETDEVTIQLTKEGLTEAAYNVTIKGNKATYSIENVLPGTYTMKVMKNNHVTREYTVVVGSEVVTQDVKIHLLGDINGDGRVNTTDSLMANKHAKKTALLTGYEFLCADVKNDGRVNTTDVLIINKHAKKTALLW